MLLRAQFLWTLIKEAKASRWEHGGTKEKKGGRRIQMNKDNANTVFCAYLIYNMITPATTIFQSIEPCKEF